MPHLPQDFLIRQQSRWDNAQLNAYLETLQVPPPISILLNPTKSNLAPFIQADWQAVPWCALGKYLPERPIFTIDPLFHAGYYYVQEAASMSIAQTVQPDIRLGLDLCAAPGGKSALLAALLPPEALLISNEPIANRAAILKDNIIRWSKPNSLICRNDPDDFKPFANVFDYVLVDAPCSGEGLWRKQPEAVHEWSLENVNFCAQRQKRILAAAIQLVKPGGYLVYSTCTFALAENEENVQWLIQTYGLIEQSLTQMKNWHWENLTHGYAAYPNRVKGEGFYLAFLQKPENRTQSSDLPQIKTLALHSSQLKTLSNWVNLPETLDYFLVEKNQLQEIYIIPKAWKNFITYCKAKLNIVNLGIPVGTIKNSFFTPHQGLALSNYIEPKIPRVAFDLATVRQYLKGAAMPTQETQSGWQIASYAFDASTNLIPLGWLKGAGKRYNNYYPQAARILMDIPQAKVAERW